MRANLSRILLAVLAAVFLGLSCSDPKVVEPPIVTPYRQGDTLRSPTADTTLSPGQLPLLITEDFVIPEGVTVTVLEGTEIMVAGLNWIDVQGVLVAHGSSASPIIFTSANTDPDLGQWRGIKLHNSNQGSSFEFCLFTYGAFFDTDTLSDRGRDAQNYKGMLAIRNSSPTISHCIVTHNQNNAVYVTGGLSNPTIEYNIFTDNDASAVRADSTVQPGNLSISYNCVADNSAPGFILSNDNPDTATGTRRMFGDLTTINVNLDSCDSHFNIDQDPLFINPMKYSWTNMADFGLQSCSPCVDAGPIGSDPDPDGTRADMGSRPYSQAAGELRGRLETDLSATTYRMSCDVVIPPGVTVVVSPGARIEATGLFNFEVYGRLLVQGTSGSPVEICPCAMQEQDLVAGFVFFERGDEPSVLQHLIVRDYNDITVNKPGIRFENCQFISAFHDGVTVETGTTELDQAVVFDHCSFTDVGETAVDVISSSAKIYNTWVNGSIGQGIRMDSVLHGVEIKNTIIESCQGTAVAMNHFCHPLIVNNTMSDCGYFGVHMENNSNPTLFNNIVINCDRYGIFAEFSSSPNISYNDVWNNGLLDSNPANYSPASLEQSGDNISLDPAFSGSDYRLTSTSPCVDRGNPDSEYNDTSYGPRNDIGAWGGPGAGAVGSGLIQRVIARR
ncbi:MAG: right-handed parallel beta-helix repeat-containing protein [Calditrichaeota bacterium]|nr:right-handed parallel beta-helix repeat-containing protein [Calditrichota bacterium]